MNVLMHGIPRCLKHIVHNLFLADFLIQIWMTVKYILTARGMN